MAELAHSSTQPKGHRECNRVNPSQCVTEVVSMLNKTIHPECNLNEREYRGASNPILDTGECS